MKAIDKEVTITSKVKLRGTLSVPGTSIEKSPAILIIPGSGKIDRNGKVNEKIDLKLYGQLAEYLTLLGFVTLRYDKRGAGESEGDFLSAGLWDFVDDARLAVQFLKSLPEVDPNQVIVLGHSEGGAIGTAVAAREDLGGLILLAGAVEKLSEALKRQREIAVQDILNAKGFQGGLLRFLGVHKKVEPQAQKHLKKVLNSSEDVIKTGLVKTNAKWFREHFAYDPKEDLAKISCPVLAITGALDIQADPDVLTDLPRYVKGDSEYYVIEDMGHACKFITKPSTMFSVKKDLPIEANLPLHPELKQRIEGWLHNHFILQHPTKQLV
jgi:uncharacterized protein